MCAIAQEAGQIWKFQTIHPFSKSNYRTNMVGHMKNKKTIYKKHFYNAKQKPTNKETKII